MRVTRLGTGLFIIAIVVMAWRLIAPAPQWREGDIIFQTSKSGQSMAIAAATFSAYTHMGILARRGNDWVVIEAAGPVRETPLRQWTDRGRFGRYAVYRRKDLSNSQSALIVKTARGLKGQPYDLFFSFDNDVIYCSELVWLAYKAAHIPVGKVQTVRSLNVGNAFADRLIRSRGPRDKACLGGDATECRQRILGRQLVTPVAIARDHTLDQLYSNYPW